MSVLDFLATEAYARRRAIEQLTAADLADRATVYGLRRLLASDPDVAVRALAAGALGSVRTPTPDPVPWLTGALADISPVVRDSAIRALARHSASAAYAPLCALARTDTTWWVRRAALYALGVIGTHAVADPVAPARAALTDPFWRVRHAAVQVLTIYGNRAPDRRAEILADVSGGTAEYLSALWGPTLVEGPHRDRIPSRLPATLLDHDPAVVTARLAEMDAPPPLAIVELLCDPHVPLRTLAAARLIEADDADAFAASLNWLDEPRIPHVAATVTTMLDSLGDAARDLATHVLSSSARPGASRWAIGWVVSTRYLDLAAPAWTRAVSLDEHALAMPIAPVAGLIDALRADDLELATAAADELLLRPAHVRREVLAAIEPHASRAVRMRLAVAAGLESGAVGIEREAGIERDVAGIERDAGIEARSPRDGRSHIDAALADVDPLARATALAIVGASVSAETRAAALADLDPAVRESLIGHASLDELSALLDVERDPWVRRAASRAVVRAIRDARRQSTPIDLGQRNSAHDPAPDRIDAERGLRISTENVRRIATESVLRISTDLVLGLSTDADEWIRTLVIPLLDPTRADHLGRIVALAADASVMVQSAIVEKLASISDEQLRRAVRLEQRAIDAWMRAGALGELDDRGIVTSLDLSLGRDVNDAVVTGDVPTAVRTMYERNRDEVDVPHRTLGSSGVSRRSFGSSGVVTTPLVISGAFDLQPGSLRAAAERGVTTYFWEPPYGGMTRFLRAKGERARSQVVTGTYHADERSIVKDVDRALKRLRRDVLDVYLLFWTRSDARVDEQAFAVMSELKRAGKVRAIGFSTHDRGLAMRAVDRSAWDVVMTRHSAAHPGIEDGMLAHANAKGAGVITFTALCYGRMLKGDGAPSAQDCYRYSLAQPGVTATISAPRRHRELVENLDVITAGAMTDAEIERVRAHGAGVRVESQRFNALIRQPTRDAAAAAMAMLEESLAPGDGDREEACVTPEALQRSLGSRGRGRASLPSAMLRRGRL